MVKWFGHVERMNEDRIEKQINEGRGRRSSRKSGLDGVDEILKQKKSKFKVQKLIHQAILQ